MEAPTKPGGTRKTRQGHDLIGRFTTFSPIEFLKRYNPLRRRGRRLKLGFDQPPQELKQLALPLRPAAPGLSTRLFRSSKRMTEALGSRALMLSGAVSARIGASAKTTLALLQPVLVAGARVRSAVSAAASRWRQSRIVCWCESKLDAGARCLALLHPAPWAASQSTVLIVRTRRIRAALLSIAVLQWSGLIALTAAVSIVTVGGNAHHHAWIQGWGLMLCALGLLGLVLHGWYQRLIAAWRAMELFICGQCGELRNFSPSNPCHACATANPPVFPGQIPSGWDNRPLLGTFCTAAPALISSMVLIATRL